MVAPITEKNDPVSYLGKTKVWFPKGDWFDIFTGMRYKGDCKMDVFRKLGEYPVFAKAGAILPTYNQCDDNLLINRETLDIQVFPGADNDFTLYQDEGEYSRFEEGHFATTSMKLKWGEKAVFTIESAEGDLKVIPKKRTFNITFRAIGSEPKTTVFVNGKAAKSAAVYDAEKHTLTVNVVAKSVETVSVELEFEGQAIYNNEDAFDRAFDILLHAQMGYETKISAWNGLKSGQGKSCFFANRLPNSAEQPVLDALREIIKLKG
jgi:hypothetical protein